MKKSLIAFSALTFWALPASAYIFDDMCAPETDHSITTGPPQVLFVLDRSGSMGDPCCDVDGDGTDDSRWTAATQTIAEVSLATQNVGSCSTFADPNCDQVNIGLGYFSSGRELAIEPAEDTNASIVTSLGNNGPSGGTAIGEAVNVLEDSMAIDDNRRFSIGTIISDGIPNNQTTTESAVRDLCTLRDRISAPIISYMVGFGDAVESGRGKAILDFLAAAGGTGTCCYQADFPCASSFEVDPCALTAAELDSAVRDNGTNVSTYIHDDWSCDGSLIATDGDALKNELLSITDAAACVFPLEIPAGYPAGAQAKDDPDATSVTINHDVWGSVALPYCPPGDTDCGLESRLAALGIDSSTASAHADDGWYFLDTQRTQVRLSDALCGQISNEDIDQVFTQVACLCTLEGQPCTFGFDAGFTNEQIANARCSVGVYECPDGSTDVCVGVAEAMPEICNGLDDDCNGITDDIEESWGSGAFSASTYDIPAALEGIDCLGANACECPDGAQDMIGGTDPASYYATWAGACSCTNALTYEDELMSVAPAEAGSEETAGCATPANTPSGLWFLLLGLLVPVGYEKLRRR